MELAGKKLFFLGDSITEGVGVSDAENIYWRILARRTGAECLGYGVSGTRIAKQLGENAEASLDFNNRAEQMGDDPDVVLVFGGTNDFGHGNVPLGNMTDDTEYTFYGAVKALCCRLIRKYPQAQLVFMTPLHRALEEISMNEIGIRNISNLAGYVAIIREVAGYYGIPILDLYTTSGFQPEFPELRQRYMPDGLHPNDAGHTIMAHKIEAFLRAL